MQIPPLFRTVRRDDIADEDLGHRVRLQLGGKNFDSLRRLDVFVEGDSVTLAGPVNSFYERQIAIASAQRVAGVMHVTDRITVRGAQSPSVN